jgi:hypothetical protein
LFTVFVAKKFASIKRRDFLGKEVEKKGESEDKIVV